MCVCDVQKRACRQVTCTQILCGVERWEMIASNESDRRGAPESLRAVTYTASTTRGCRFALSTGSV